MLRPTAVLSALFLFAATAITARAGELTIAVVQYATAKTQESLAAGFAAVKLSEVTNSDRVESGDMAIRGGRVLFAQTISTGPSASFASSTRLGVQRADFSGRFKAPNLKVQVTIQDGVDIGIRKFSRTTFAGAGALQGGIPTILSIRETSGKTQTAVKTKTKIEEYNLITLVIGQWEK